MALLLAGTQHPPTAVLHSVTLDRTLTFRSAGLAPCSRAVSNAIALVCSCWFLLWQEEEQAQLDVERPVLHFPIHTVP